MNQLPKVKFVFTGDSITNYWDIETALNISTSSFINTGIPGNTSTQLLKRFKQDALNYHADHLVLLIGINDMWPLELSPYYRGPLLSVESIKDRLFTNYNALITQCLEQNQSLIICSILPTNLDFSNCNPTRNQLIAQVNQQLKTWCTQHNLIYVDYHAALVDEESLTINYGITFDGLHLNKKGYDLFTIVLKETLANHNISLS